MNFVFRVDSSLVIGSGHVYRCLSLANQLKKFGHDLSFICTDHPGNICSIIRSFGFKVSLIPAGNSNIDPELTSSWLGRSYRGDAKATISNLEELPRVDYMVVDHYGIDSRWEAMLKPCTRHLVVIDDLANRFHHCDTLLDQTYARDLSAYYPLVPEFTNLLLGTDFALLRDEFLQFKDKILVKRKNTSKVKSLLVSLGGTDRNNVTKELMLMLENSSLNSSVRITIIVGPNNPHQSSLVDVSNTSRFTNYKVLFAVSNMAEILSQHDLAIGASGASAWERCALGLPSISIELAENQKEICKILEHQGASIALGSPSELNGTKLEQALNYIQSNYQSMVSKSIALVDAHGSRRAAACIFQTSLKDGLLVHLKLANSNDCQQLFEWQQEPATREYALNPSIPSYIEHQLWFQRQLSDKNYHLYMVSSKDTQLGMLRLDWLVEFSAYEVSIVTPDSSKRLGVAKAALELAIILMPKTDFYATILPQNVASLALFRKQGFQYIGNNRFRYAAKGCSA
ncbi:UDP-2,4-diacetamido-2,4,6-trideoxy-beta-L-altropyranose hydrolase [Alginatibacterium sediminis]|uniref:UDP-2,4-diacetamido-2,4, 6-trideoxy-beta-L-altropyranose hydrolase n=1 Tax=Alginatibacterium sediminis TaxID=2164068 RepID=A0A420EG50_9ALTE|nr:UDP-2,4-diacetamido-2,4,6-trideoxy-beta-L-altropyranose hydrolase [Alginatibacterium sediminis]RKF19648.1 UDP-2,4-diacetamido-2,4,6-trideoxy-beta-L-altropyranose hydrolase [Alginatibacterium sediminis]